MDNPPADWLKAAQLGYESPKAKRLRALENTKQMFGILKAKEGGTYPGMPQVPQVVSKL